MGKALISLTNHHILPFTYCRNIQDKILFLWLLSTLCINVFAIGKDFGSISWLMLVLHLIIIACLYISPLNIYRLEFRNGLLNFDMMLPMVVYLHWACSEVLLTGLYNGSRYIYNLSGDRTGTKFEESYQRYTMSTLLWPLKNHQQ